MDGEGSGKEDGDEGLGGLSGGLTTSDGSTVGMRR